MATKVHQVTVNVKRRAERHVPSSVRKTVASRYHNGEYPVCPLSKRQFEGSGSSCQLSHIVPKCAQQVLSKEQDVVNNPDNIIPTFSIVHEQMELKNATPNLSFKFKEHQGEFDLYELVFSSSITHDNILLKIMSPGDNVLLHQSSFMFLQVHKRVFDSYSMLRAGNIETTHALCLGNLVTSYVLFSGAQRFLNERNKGLIEEAKAEEKAGRKLKKRKPSRADKVAEVLSMGTVELRSGWWRFPRSVKIKERPVTLEVKMLKFNTSTKCFEMVIIGDFDDKTEMKSFCDNYTGVVGHKNKRTVYCISLGDFDEYVVKGPNAHHGAADIGIDSAANTQKTKTQIYAGAFARQDRSCIRPLPIGNYPGAPGGKGGGVLPEAHMQPAAMGQLRDQLLAKRQVNIRSDWWDHTPDDGEPIPESYKAELLRFSSGKFEFVLVDECNTEQLGWLRASYKGRLSKAAARGMPAIYRIALTVLAGHLLEPGR